MKVQVPTIILPASAPVSDYKPPRRSKSLPLNTDRDSHSAISRFRDEQTASAMSSDQSSSRPRRATISSSNATSHLSSLQGLTPRPPSLDRDGTVPRARQELISDAKGLLNSHPRDTPAEAHSPELSARNGEPVIKQPVDERVLTQKPDLEEFGYGPFKSPATLSMTKITEAANLEDRVLLLEGKLQEIENVSERLGRNSLPQAQRQNDEHSPSPIPLSPQQEEIAVRLRLGFVRNQKTSLRRSVADMTEERPLNCC